MRPLKQSAIDGNGSDSSNGAIEPPVLEANALEASEQEFNYTHNNGARETDSASRDSNGQEAKEPEPHTLNGEALSGKLQHKSNVRSKNGTVRASKEQVKGMFCFSAQSLSSVGHNVGISAELLKSWFYSGLLKAHTSSSMGNYNFAKLFYFALHLRIL